MLSDAVFPGYKILVLSLLPEAFKYGLDLELS